MSLTKLTAFIHFLIGQLIFYYNPITLLAALSTIYCTIDLIFQKYKYTFLWINRRKSKRSQLEALEYHIDASCIKASQNHQYIITRFQDVDPCNKEELIENHTDSSCISSYYKMKMFFSNNENVHHYLLLADSGMGKTTFLYHLFFTYNKRLFRRYETRFIPLLLDDALDKIKQIENPSRTILLLDGLNENDKAIKNPSKYFEKIISSTMNFHRVIITCRTQFFNNEQEEPGYNNCYKINGKTIPLRKKYISPLIQEDVYQKYSSYKIWNRKNHAHLKILMQKSPMLLTRPMLVAYMENIAKNKKIKCNYVHEIYHEIIMSWLYKEWADITNSLVRRLFEFHQILAEYMYYTKQSCITKSDLKNFCQLMNISIKWRDIKNKSLLNRNNIGNYKFSHKSIWEYFIAVNAFSNLNFRKEFVKNKPENYPMALLFLQEMSEKILDEYLHNPCIPLTDKPLSYLLFSNVTLSNADLDRINFEGSDFSNACLYKCNFSNSNLKGANLKNTCLNDCVMSKANLNGALFLETDIVKIPHILMAADFSHIVLENNAEIKEVSRAEISIYPWL